MPVEWSNHLEGNGQLQHIWHWTTVIETKQEMRNIETSDSILVILDRLFIHVLFHSSKPLTPLSHSSSIEGLFELTLRPLRVLNLAYCIPEFKK